MRLTINYKKTNCILFSLKKDKDHDQFRPSVSTIDVIKNMGVLLDNKLTWKIVYNLLLKSCVLKGIMSKLLYYVPVYVFKCVF